MNTADALVKKAAMASASSLSTKVTYGASGIAIWSGVNLEAIGIVVGIVIAIISFLFNFYFRKKEHDLNVRLAHKQLDAVAHAAVSEDEKQKELIKKVKEIYLKEFGDKENRKNGDRRVWDDPDYIGPERRKGVRRRSVSGDTDAAKALRAVLESTQKAIDELENGANKHS
jgi:hypothetical protein